MFTPPFTFTPEQERLRQDVRELLRVRCREDLVRARRARPWRHPDLTYRRLGERGWLAPDWPAEYGGLGLSLVESAIVAEEMALAGVPDSARVNTVDNAGSTLLVAGTDEQKARFLPAMAAAERLFVVLYSEPDAGSDLGGLATHAEREGDGWRLSGEKIWNVGANKAEYGICLARTGEGKSKYAGLSIFLVPLHVDGVRIGEIPGFNPEAFDHIVFDDVRLPADALVGTEGEAWQLVNEVLAVERTGVYFYGHAQRWFDLLTRFELPARAVSDVRGLQADLPAARLLTWHAVDLLSRGEDAAAAAAGAKWWTSELTSRVAALVWSVREAFTGREQVAARRPAAADRVDGLPTDDVELTTALSEAPGLTVAGGTSEMMLATVSAALFDEAREVA
ncbi:acyl-CoA dehydrogenase [Amycolatopsis sp. WAC 01376]|uniref:acyl-CoA dehydrogenase family protein n=1 Tax=Amycolatopsis sp. WAC 01376 TaxID=2203195 RepID=UPI000F76D49B|nr:acyl-CoA dehydrogenase family protein [Amycolatopsis sp. WAC 01376]RSM57415.1 acyl-CoA dehydrogenase [Amycolatopsis sp. WAC 01376]